MTDHSASNVRVGRYEILARLSSGGMAELFLACVSGPGGFKKFVALKRILPHMRDNEEFITMFLEEARLTATLSHANIAQVYDLSEASDELFIAMEYVEGQDLSRVLKLARNGSQQVPEGFSCAVLKDAALALHYAHHHTTPGGRPLTIVHRDISPANIMITYTGTTKLIDFGIAKARGSIGSTGAGQVKGSCAYMSPEQIRGDDLDGRSDLFSLGVVMWEALVGQRLFHGNDDVVTMHRILNNDVEPPHVKNPKVSRAASDVVVKALSRDREQRFATGKEMASAIEQAVTLYDEEQRARLMKDYFGDAISRVRAMLSLASQKDTRSLAEAAGRLSAVAAADSAATPTRSDVGSRPNSPGPEQRAVTATVLVVDDSAVGRKLVETFLAPEGFRIIAAGSGAEALEILNEMSPHLIILDVRMPEMDGFELCERIRQREDLRTTPILFLSAACSLEERSRGLMVGGDDFLRKPYQGAELLARVRAHLQRIALMKR